MSPEPLQLLVPAVSYLKLGSFTKASTAVTPPKEWPMMATLVRSRLSCKRERAEESEPKPHCWRSPIREEEAKGRSAKSPCKGGKCPVPLLV